MAIARVSVLEFDSAEALAFAQESHKRQRAKVFLDLSRNCAAPLTAYYALKENTHGKQTNSRI